MFATFRTCSAALDARTALLRELVGFGGPRTAGELPAALASAIALRGGPFGWVMREARVPSDVLGDACWDDLPDGALDVLPLGIDCSTRGDDLEAIWHDLREVRRLTARVGSAARVRSVTVDGELTLRGGADRLLAHLRRQDLGAVRLLATDRIGRVNDLPYSRPGAPRFGVDLLWVTSAVDPVPPPELRDDVAACVARGLPFCLTVLSDPDPDDVHFSRVLGLLVGAMLLAQNALTRSEFDAGVGRTSDVRFDGPLLTWQGHVLTASEISLLRRNLILGCRPASPVPLVAVV